MKQVWIHPSGNRSKVVILTDEAILLANPGPKQLRRFQDSILESEAKTALLADCMQVIPLISVLKLQSDRERSQIRIVHGFGGKPSHSLAQFDELGTRDNAFETLRQALGLGFSIGLRETGKLKSGWKPLGKALLVIILAIFMRGSAVQAAELEAAGSGQEGLMIFGPTAIPLVASLLVLYFLRDFYRRTQNPVPLLELVRDGSPQV